MGSQVKVELILIELSLAFVMCINLILIACPPYPFRLPGGIKKGPCDSLKLCATFKINHLSPFHPTSSFATFPFFSYDTKSELR